MIDEALYRQATDELDSDRRHPQLWERARALAGDDHDEARYLYSDLRVGEMIADAGAHAGPRADFESTDDDGRAMRRAHVRATSGPAVLELDGDGPTWSIHESAAGRFEAVKEGVCWPAFFMTLPWLLARGLFAHAAVYALLWITSIAGLLLTGLAGPDAGVGAGAGAGSGSTLAFAGFGAIAVTGLLLLPLFRANRWHRDRLIGRGAKLRAAVRGRSAEEALGRLSRHGLARDP